jgi:hypothetical protein
MHTRAWTMYMDGSDGGSGSACGVSVSVCALRASTHSLTTCAQLLISSHPQSGICLIVGCAHTP